MFGGLEVRQTKQIAVENSVRSDASLVIEDEDQVAANPDVWMRGCPGQDLSAAD